MYIWTLVPLRLVSKYLFFHKNCIIVNTALYLFKIIYSCGIYIIKLFLYTSLIYLVFSNTQSVQCWKASECQAGSSVSPEMTELWMRLHFQPSLDGLFFLRVCPLSPRVTTYSDAPTHLYFDVLRSMVPYECVSDDVSDGAIE